MHTTDKTPYDADNPIIRTLDSALGDVAFDAHDAYLVLSWLTKHVDTDVNIIAGVSDDDAFALCMHADRASTEQIVMRIFAQYVLANRSIATIEQVVR